MSVSFQSKQFCSFAEVSAAQFAVECSRMEPGLCGWQKAAAEVPDSWLGIFCVTFPHVRRSGLNKLILMRSLDFYNLLFFCTFKKIYIRRVRDHLKTRKTQCTWHWASAREFEQFQVSAYNPERSVTAAYVAPQAGDASRGGQAGCRCGAVGSLMHRPAPFTKQSFLSEQLLKDQPHTSKGETTQWIFILIQTLFNTECI